MFLRGGGGGGGYSVVLRKPANSMMYLKYKSDLFTQILPNTNFNTVSMYSFNVVGYG